MKRKAEENSEYIDSSSSDSGSDTEDLEQKNQDDYASDSQINYAPNGQMLIILNPTDFHIPREEEPVSSKPASHARPPKQKKTKLDTEREEILKRIKSLTTKKTLSLRDRIIFSSLKDEHKHYLLQQYEERASSSSNSEKTKNAEYIEKALSIPYGVYKDINPSTKLVPEFILNLRKNLDEAIYGHGETKEEIIDYITSKLRNPDSNPSILALKSAPGLGKCHLKDTRIMMADGSVKFVQDIVVGDELMGDDSTPRTVLALGRGHDLMYRIKHTQSNREYVVNKEHILCLRNILSKEELEIPVKDFVKMASIHRGAWRGMCARVNFPKRKLDVEPYTIGQTYASCYWRIPTLCIFNDVQTRLLFLQGVVDTVGSYGPANVNIFLNGSYGESIDHLMFLIYSLGFIASKETKPNGVVIINIFGDANVYIKYPELFNDNVDNIKTEPIVIEEYGVDEYYGFTLDGNNRFLLGDSIITHNTKFVRALGKALDLPFQQISFGGLNDASVLTGHDYTYTGSKPGRIYETLVKSKCMNGIVYLDEIDKIGTPDSDKYIQVNGILTHLLDKEQNSEFYDNYIGGIIPLDLSKILFIVSFNNEYNVDPVVLNRLKVIEIKENSLKDKINIVTKFTIPETLKNLRLNDEKFVISENTIKYVILHKTVFEKGMRSINKNFNTIFGKINTMLYLEKAPKQIKDHITRDLSYEKIIIERNSSGKILITKELVDKLLYKQSTYEPYMTMYN